MSWQNPYLPEGCTNAMIEEAFGYDLPDIPQCTNCLRESSDLIQICDGVEICADCFAGDYDYSKRDLYKAYYAVQEGK